MGLLFVGVDQKPWLNWENLSEFGRVYLLRDTPIIFCCFDRARSLDLLREERLKDILKRCNSGAKRKIRPSSRDSIIFKTSQSFFVGLFMKCILKRLHSIQTMRILRKVLPYK